MHYIESNLSGFIEPAYSTDYPNQKIPLYKDEVQCLCEIDGEMREFSGQAFIEYTWHPTLRATFKIDKIDCSNFSTITNPKQSGEIHLRLQNSDKEIVGRVHNVEAKLGSSSTILTMSGVLSGKTYINKDNDNVNHVVFHIVNFTHFEGLARIRNKETGEHRDRLVFVESDWKIVIEQLASSEQSFKDLKETGGYSITHVGRIQKIDDDSFSMIDVSEIMGIFSFFLSFMKGSRVPIILLVGYDKQGIKICEEWKSDLPSHPYQERLSWMPNNNLSYLPSVFPDFVCWWNEWGKTAILVINLYLEANCNNLMDVRIVFSCSVLEMLARFILVEEKQKKTEQEFDDSRKYPTADRITDLLQKFSIPTDFPPSDSNFIKNLSEFVENNIPEKDWKRKSASKALMVFVKIRNEMTHANKQYKDKLTPIVLFEVASLGLWYIEMTILARLNYNGVYKNRLNKNQWAEPCEYDHVPWYTPEGSSKSEVQPFINPFPH
jgi:ApeA N-terminal domain 1